MKQNIDYKLQKGGIDVALLLEGVTRAQDLVSLYNTNFPGGGKYLTKFNTGKFLPFYIPEA